ncbi:MAG: hypothetical protein DHS20C01_10760 [marine bacterium B5-7]|nr:MAG: hypothetical protein DHS20C01_10760 [marine bacterium B5-7]
MFRRKTTRWQGSIGKRSLFGGRNADTIKLPKSTLHRTPALRLKKTRTSEHASGNQSDQPRVSRPFASSLFRNRFKRGQSRPSPRVREVPHRRGNRLALTIANALLTCSIVLFWPAAMGTVEHSRDQIWGVDQAGIQRIVAKYLDSGTLPDVISSPELPGESNRLYYNIDPDLQAAIESELAKYQPDYGMAVAMDAETGKILAMADIQRDGNGQHNLNLQSTYPAASVFKTVTAAAAIDLGKADATTVIPYNGKRTTLYKKNVLKHQNNKWTRHEPLSEAYAKSANAAFARLGLYTVGGEKLLEYSDRFDFNGPLDADMPVGASSIEMDPAEPWSVAETAAGYTRGTNMSPIHGAMLAATIANDGVMPSARLIDAVTDEHGIILYESDDSRPHRVISAKAASEMRKLMRQTVISGSARKSFRGFDKNFGDIEVGGKTGSLTGFTPKGKYDWFVGYATDGERKLAFAVLCINKDYWYVKSTLLARKLVESYFSEKG